MTTKLEGPGHEVPALQPGRQRRRRQPGESAGGHRTAYLWEEVWARESWLEILGPLPDRPARQEEADRARSSSRASTSSTSRASCRPPCSRTARAASTSSSTRPGSGKTNSIAWTAHFLAELHDAQHKKVFDTVLVVSDRNVIDAQLQEALFDFQRTTGVVATITGKDGSKSGELAEALSGDKKIVVCTIQTFPFALEAVRELAATEGKRFAVIADEAHSSQTGEAAAKLKAVLSAEELAKS
jgi:type I restriction enzyme R subunit